MNTSNQTDLALHILSGACAKCYNHHDGECVAVDVETLYKLHENVYFNNAFNAYMGTPKQENNLMGTYMGKPVYLKRKNNENTNS